MKVSSMFDGNLGKYLLPGIVLQSVMIGGGYATGREIVEYGAKFGAYGWYAGLGIMLGFALVAVLCYELIRLYHVYDYKSFIQSIAGPLYPVFDLVYTVFMVIILAVMSSATGAVVQQMFGVSHWFGVVGIMVVAGLLNFFGEKVISFSKPSAPWPSMQDTSLSRCWSFPDTQEILQPSWPLQTIPMCPMPPWVMLSGQAFSTWPATWWYFLLPSSPLRNRRNGENR